MNRILLTLFLLLCSLLTANAAQDKENFPKPELSNEPSTYCRYIHERRNDFAWENDKVAFRVYGGPREKKTTLNSGIDCWMKRVDYPIVNKWYWEAFSGVSSYHEDIGEGHDNYDTGWTTGCGGTALWIDGKPVLMGRFINHEVIEQTKERSQFILDYETDPIDGVVYGERKHITIELGTQLFHVRSTFTKDGKPAPGLPICIGLTTLDGKGTPSSNREKGWIAVSEMNGKGKDQRYWMGTAVVMDDPNRIDSIEIIDGKEDVEYDAYILILCKTDEDATVSYHAGFAWERAGEITSEEEWEDYLNQQ